MAFTVRIENIRDPLESEQTIVRIERVVVCDGTQCGTAISDDGGGPVSRVRHDHHLVISGYNPLASPHYIAIPR